MSDLIQKYREAIESGDAAPGEDFEPLLAEIERLTAELKIKSEWISTRQCPDHSGKWPRGTCLQCRVEALEGALEGLHYHHKKFEPLCKLCVDAMMIVDLAATEPGESDE